MCALPFNFWPSYYLKLSLYLLSTLATTLTSARLHTYVISLAVLGKDTAIVSFGESELRRLESVLLLVIFVF
jgi:hypothetical protein